MAIWITTGFFEVVDARVTVGGVECRNAFQCIPDSLPAPPGPDATVVLHPGAPFEIAISPGPLVSRFEAAMKSRAPLPFVEVRAAGGATGDVLRLDRIAVLRVSAMKGAGRMRHVRIVQAT